MCGSESSFQNIWFHTISYVWSQFGYFGNENDQLPLGALVFSAQCGAHHSGEFRPFAERWARPFIESELQLVHRWPQDWENFYWENMGK